MPLYNKIIRDLDKEKRKNEDELGTNDPLNLRDSLEATGEFIGDQYQKLPENVRGTLGDITGAMATGAKLGIEMNKHKPFTTFDVLNAAYKPIQLIKDEASRKTGLDPINFDATDLAVDLAPPIPLGKAKVIIDEAFEYGAKKGIQNIPSKKVYAAFETDWSKYGYNRLPTQVKKAKNIELVSKSLDEFYSRVNRIIGSIEGSQGITSGRAKEVLKQIPTWWTHPETGKLYRSAWNSKEKRLTIKPISRNLLENQQTSIIQKRNYRKYKKEIASMNETLKKELETTQLELNALDQDFPSVMRHAGSMGKDGSSKSAVMNSFFAKRNQLVKKIEDLTNGKYYTEHGYYLLSEKVRNKVVDSKYVSINNSKEFQLGNLTNQYVTKNVDKFSEFKTRIETAIDSLNDGYYNYPDLVVGYNPKLEGTEYIIRIEDLNSLKVGKDIKGVLSGDAVLGKNGKPLKIDFNDKELVKKLSSTEGVKQWLSENGIEASSKELSRKPEKIIVRQDRKTLETKSETRNRIMSMLDQVYDMRISVEDYLKSIGAVAGDSPTKIGRPKGATDLKTRKIQNKDQSKLF